MTEERSHSIVIEFGIGSILAVILSWGLNKSILWAILHGWLGWLYVIYYALVHYK